MRLKTVLMLLKGVRGSGPGQPVLTAPGIVRQLDIYRRGLLGLQPSFPVRIEELEARAKSSLKREVFDYVAGGAGGEQTMKANISAFGRWKIVQRMLRNVGTRDLSVDLLGQKIPVPFLLAPIGVQGIVHGEGEVAVAKACSSLGVPLVLSTASSKTMEEVAKAMKSVPRWYQLYWPKHHELTVSLIRRAEHAGYSALVVTLDTPLLSWRERDIQNAYLPFLFGEGLANYFADPVFRSMLGKPPEKDPMAAIRLFAQVFSDPTLNWDRLKWLRKETKLPILLKGILHPDDARRALHYDVDGIIVSNHGGRQVDGAVAALDALPPIVNTVGKKTVVLFDSGIRRAADVFKAIALGADAVLIGRPYTWGLAVGGAKGVRHVLQNLIAELDLTLGLSGYCTFQDLDQSALQISSREF